MNRVLSRAQIRELDRIAINELNVPGLLLMENAGRGAAEIVLGMMPGPDARVLIVCGAGNNGGDGFVVARQLDSWDVDAVDVWLIGEVDKVRGDARVNLDAWVGLGGTVNAVWNPEDLPFLETAIADADVVVDALFGTGLDREVKEPYARVIEAINDSSTVRVSLDLPSGLDADTGVPLGIAVRAHSTVTFGALKPGLLTPSGAEYAGTVHVAKLGVPDRLFERTGWDAEVIQAGEVLAGIAPRRVSAHKHAAGDVLIVAGAPGRTGAALLVARGALRTGAGLATVASWPAAVDALQAHVPEVMTAPIDPSAIGASLDGLLKGRSAVALGPGLGVDDQARAVIEHVVLGWNGVKVVDADAITAFAGRPEALSEAPGRLILTPHPGEMGRLLGISGAQVERDRFGAVREAVKRTGAVVVLKGARTLVAWPGSKVQVSAAGSPVLATAGSGDVLCGIIAGLACSLPAERAAIAGVQLHARAGEEWQRRNKSDRGMLAGEIADALPGLISRWLDED